VPRNDEQALRLRWGLLLFNFAVLAVLLIVWFAYIQGLWPISDLVREGWIRVELHAIWFAILGGVAISIKGLTDHWRAKEWGLGRWELWYISRPFNGIVVGSVTYLALQVANTSSPPSVGSVAIASFIFGMQDRRFYAFIAAIGKVLLTVPDDSGALTIREIDPSEAPAGAVVMVLGSGMGKDSTVTVGGAPLEDLQVSADGSVAVGKLPAGTGKADVVVANPDGTAQTLAGGVTYIDKPKGRR
jgi:hypothetical protein